MWKLWSRFKEWLEWVAGLDESPHQLALGFGIGIFVGFLPCMGVQTWVALPMAIAARGNKMLAVAGVWISNPVTFVPFYYTCYRVGLVLYTPEAPLGLAQFQALAQEATIARMLEIGKALVVPLTLGSLVLGVPSGILAYFALRLYLRRRRELDLQEESSTVGGTEGQQGPDRR